MNKPTNKQPGPQRVRSRIESRLGKGPAKRKPERAQVGDESSQLTGAPPDLNIGGRLRHARFVQGFNLREVAVSVGVSEGYISKLENDKVRPSLTTLHRLASVLKTNIGALVADGGPFDDTVTVIKPNERPVLQFAGARSGDGIRLEKLIPSLPDNLLQVNIHVIAPGAGGDPIQHKGQEFGFVLEGELELQVGDRTHRITVGDAFSFNSERPHGYRNTGTSPARVLWVNTPPTF